MRLWRSCALRVRSRARTWIPGGKLGSRNCGKTLHVVHPQILTSFARFLDALFYAVDGNFHANLKKNPLDEDDVPLSKGAAYFADEDAFAEFIETLGPLEGEVRGLSILL